MKSMKSVMATIVLAAALGATIGTAMAQNKPAPTPIELATRTYIGFGGDCYQEPSVATINRCLTQSTRH